MFYHLTPIPAGDPRIGARPRAPDWPHPLPHARLPELVPTAQAHLFRSGYTRVDITLAQGESFPAHFEHYVKRPDHTGAGAAGTATVSGGSVTAVALTSGGTERYDVAPPVAISGDGDGAEATAVLTDGAVTAVRVTAGGTGYTAATVSFTDPRRTYTTLADWEPADHKTPAKDAADRLLAHVERGLARVLADEFHHHVSAAKRDPFHRMQAELAHEAAVRQAVHVAIDARGTGEPIGDERIRGMIAAARTLRNPTITGTVKSGTRGRTLASVSGAAAPGASVRARGVNVTDASRPPLPWTAWRAADASTGAYTVVGLTVGAIANDVGDRIRIEVEQWPGGAAVSTTALSHVVI